MRFPAMRGRIDRRILLNYRVDPERLAAILPAPFRPKLQRGMGVAGICLIRIVELRPRGLPALFGLRSENAAHRAAVEWDGPDGLGEGVYVFRRDSDSRLNACVGGRLFSGHQELASFTVAEESERVSVALVSRDNKVRMSLRGRLASALPPTSIFGDLGEASSFFEAGAIGYSPLGAGRFEGTELRCRSWKVSALEVEEARSSLFDDPIRFPSGAVSLDHALHMSDIDHEWIDRGELCCDRALPLR